MKNEFTLAFNEILEEKQLPKEIILKALESAMVSAYRRAVNASTAQEVEAKVDIETGKVTIFAEKEVVESVEDDRTEVSLENARKVNPDVELGGMVVVECTPSDFGRVAAQTARQVIQQRIRDAERDAQFAYYEKQLGEIVSGVVQAVNASGLTVGLELRTEASMPRKEMIQGERFHVHDRVRALVADAKETQRGPQIILSRTHRNFLRRLLENEVPEIFHGVVEIRSIAREPGERAKVAVSASQPGIDPVGACVGIRGVRIQAIVRELHDEKIDVIEWNPDPAAFIAKAISPARVSGVYLNEKRAEGGKTATMVVPEDQLSLAIGRDGQNARLAAKLTGWRIDIKSLPEAAGDALYKLANDPELASLAETEAETARKVEDMLARKADGKPLTPEEYDQMTRFVDRVEKKSSQQREAEKKAEEERLAAVKELVPASSFEVDILDSGLTAHVSGILQEAGFKTLGDLAIQMKLNADEIFKLPGIGPKIFENIQNRISELDAQLEAEKAAEAEVTPVEETPVAAPQVEEAVPVVEETAPVVEEAEPVAEETPQAVEVETTPVPETTPVVEPQEEVEEPSFDELFKLRPEVIEHPALLEEEEGDQSSSSKKKGKKKGTRVEVTYDPERDVTVVRRKHKRGQGDWEWDE